MKLSTEISLSDVRDAINCIADLDARLVRAELDRVIPTWLRGDFDTDTVNLLRSEFVRLLRMAGANSDGNSMTDVVG